jgi:hypothetical protein
MGRERELQYPRRRQHTPLGPYNKADRYINLDNFEDLEEEVEEEW